MSFPTITDTLSYVATYLFDTVPCPLCGYTVFDIIKAPKYPEDVKG